MSLYSQLFSTLWEEEISKTENKNSDAVMATSVWGQRRCNSLQWYDFTNIPILGSGKTHGLRFICVIILFLSSTCSCYIFAQYKVSYLGGHSSDISPGKAWFPSCSIQRHALTQQSLQFFGPVTSSECCQIWKQSCSAHWYDKNPRAPHVQRENNPSPFILMSCKHKKFCKKAADNWHPDTTLVLYLILQLLLNGW